VPSSDIITHEAVREIFDSLVFVAESAKALTEAQFRCFMIYFLAVNTHAGHLQDVE
jgi:hypothetical protein